MCISNYERIIDQYASEQGHLLYRYVMGDNSEHMHYGLYKNSQTPMQQALNNACQRLFELAMGAQHVNSTGRILDLGAGAGGPSECLLKWTQARLMCVDVGDAPLLKLKSRADRTFPNRLEIETTSFEALPIGWTDSFDMVWSQDAFCHGRDRFAIFCEVKRVLKTNGVFAFSDIMVASHALDEYTHSFTSVNAATQLDAPEQYWENLKGAGFTHIHQEDWTEHLQMNFNKMIENCDRYRNVLLANGVSADRLDTFQNALKMRLDWPEGNVLKWIAFVCQ